MNKLFNLKNNIPELRFNKFDSCWNNEKLNKFLIENNLFQNNLGKRITVRLNLKGVCARELKTNEKIGKTTQYIRNFDDFIYGKQNIHKGAFGVIPKELDNYVSSSDIPSFKCNNQLSSCFLFYYFSRKKIYSSLEEKMSGTGSKRLQTEAFLNLKITIPILYEQKKISSFLANFDRNINSIEKFIIFFRKQKKYYLNNLFL